MPATDDADNEIEYEWYTIFAAELFDNHDSDVAQGPYEKHQAEILQSLANRATYNIARIAPASEVAEDPNIDKLADLNFSPDSAENPDLSDLRAPGDNSPNTLRTAVIAACDAHDIDILDVDDIEITNVEDNSYEARVPVSGRVLYEDLVERQGTLLYQKNGVEVTLKGIADDRLLLKLISK